MTTGQLLCFAWVAVAGMLGAAITTPHDIVGLRSLYHESPDVPAWVKFMVIYVVVYGVILLWPVTILARSK